jgi:hypothetical protein
MMIVVRGHLSVSLPLLFYLTLPFFIYISPTPFYHPQRLHTKPMTFIFKVQQLVDIDSPKVVDFLLLPLLVPQQYRTCLGHIRTGSHDTTTPPAVTWTAIYGRLGTGGLGTVILSILFVV